MKNICKERVICVWKHLTERGGKKRKKERDNPCFLIPAGASSPLLLGESAVANGIGANGPLCCGYETVVDGTVSRQ